MRELIKEIAALSQMVNTSKGLTPIVDPIKNRLINCLKSEYGFIILEKEDSRGLLYPSFPTENHFPSEKHENDLMKINDWMKNRHGNLVIKTNAELEKIDGLETDWINQLLGMHLVTSTKRFGTLYLVNKDDVKPFTDDEICFVQTCVNLMANSLENFYLRKVFENKLQKVLTLNRSLFLENSRYKSNLEHLGFAVIITDPLGKVTYMNQSARKFFNFSKDKIQKDLFDDPALYDFNEIIQESIRRRSIIREEITTVNGKLRFVTVISSPVYSSNKGLSGVVISFDESLRFENQNDGRLFA